MNISGFLGFGWIPVVYAVVLGFGIFYSTGWVRWLIYACFVIVVLYMAFRFKTYSRQPWRSVHYRGMKIYAGLAGHEFDLAKKEKREFDITVPCRILAEKLFGQQHAADFVADELLADTGRKSYLMKLAKDYRNVFLENVRPEKHTAVLDSIRQDLEASELGPDIVIAKAVEKSYGREEAARYLLALLLGQVK
ncbi:MAG: hypothetical protein M0T74_01210 [Desulfitobacterium hafniense]|nr:hypothetical protein [Desulfitobacterium hafniense]